MGVVLRVDVLGPTRVEVDGRPIPSWPRPAARRLVVLLALAERHHRRRDALVADLFGHLDPRAGARALSKALSQARSVLDVPAHPGLLEADLQGVWLRDDVEVRCDLLEARDALARAAEQPTPQARVRALREALAEHAGEPLADDVDEPWAAPHRAELESARERARTAVDDVPLPRPTTPAGTGVPLVGREPQVARLLSLAAGPLPAVVVVAGDVGAGKSGLLRHVARQLADQGWRLGMGTSTPPDARLPLVALRAALARLGVDDLAPTGARTTPRGSSMDAARLATVVESALVSASLGRPTAVVLDDLHWADPATRQVVHRLADATEGRWLLLAGWRTGDPGAPPLSLPSSAQRIDLPDLPPEAAEALVGRVRPELDEAARAAVVRRAGGNPLFLRELARADDDHAGLPASLVDVLRRRIGVLPAEATRLLALLALAGEDAEHAVVARVAPVAGLAGEPEVMAALEALLASGLVDEVDGGVRVSHPLLAEVARSATPALRRSRLHAAIADAARERGGEAAVLQEARHRLAAWHATREPAIAGPAVESALAAGQVARVVAGREVAESLLGEGLAIAEEANDPVRERLRPQLLAARLALGRLTAEAGRMAEAEEALRHVLDTGDASQRASAWLVLGHPAYAAGDLAGAAETYRRGLDDVGDDPVARAMLTSAHGWVRIRLGDLTARDDLAEAAAVLEEAGDWAAATTALDRWGASLNPMDTDPEGALAALPILDRALAAARRANEPTELAVVQMHRVPSLAAHGRDDEADAALAEALALSRRAGAGYHLSVAHWTGAVLHAGRGDLEGALAHRDAERELLVTAGNDVNLAICDEHRAELLDGLGRDDEADAARTAAAAARDRAELARQLDRVHGRD